MNKQLYKESADAGNLVEQLLMESGLHNPQLPNQAIAHEKPEHGVILLLKLQGLTNKEIAGHTGYTEPWVSQVMRQPWFQLKLESKLRDAGSQVLEKMIELEGPNSLNTLVELRDSATSESVRATCAMRILDQCVGKAVQKTEVKTTSLHTIVKLEKIEQELRIVEEEEARLLSGNG